MSIIKAASISFCLVSLCSLSACQSKEPAASDQDPARYVDPFIGTGGHGHTFPGATLPFGMVQLSPDTRLEGWDGCSGYHYTDTILYGFSHTHLSGTGVPDYCDILMMPTTGPVRLNNGADGRPGYRSVFHKASEKASPGYYSAELKDYPIKAELTATERTGFHRYTFDGADTANLIIDLLHRDELLQGNMWQVSDTGIEGFRISKSWAEEQHVYFAARFSRPILSILDTIIPLPSNPIRPTEEAAQRVKAALRFDVSDGEPLLVKVGISAVSAENARRNLVAETPHWDFDKTRNEAREEWNRQLSKIAIQTADEEVNTIFYTALYHTSVAPNLFTDADKAYRGPDKNIHLADHHTQYTVFSLWDTYRAAHPLYTIIEPERTQDFINSFLRHYEQTGELPVWELAGNETYCMIGYHSASVIADAYLKGIRGFAEKQALEAMVATANKDNFGKPAYRSRGFIPSEQEPESVSKTLEYAYDDWCIAQMAKALEEPDIYETFLRRAQSYKNIFDPTTGFMRARNRHRWVSPFDPAEVNFHFTEANAWQYSFYVPQDVSGWADLLGGREKAVEKLDALFAASSETTGRDQADITGLIGQYAHGNEPSHHMAYLYNFLGQPWKAQERVHEILATQYANAPDGLSGNEDCGQMSAWYVLSALGFYPVTPGSGIYIIGSPAVERASIPVAGGKTFRIEVKNGGRGNPYIQSAKLNGQVHTQGFIRHEDIVAGGILEFEMGSDPNTQWGTGEGNMPQSQIDEHLIVPVPAVSKGRRAFFGQDTIEMNTALAGANIYFSLDGPEPSPQSGHLYEGPIVIDQTATLRAIAHHPDLGASQAIATQFFKIPSERTIRLGTAYAPQYAAGGADALIDFIEGGQDYRTGEWQGYEGVNLEAVVDLGKMAFVDSVAITFLQDENSWIFMPLRVEFLTSSDGKNFKPAGTLESPVTAEQKGTILHSFKTNPGVKARYIQVRGVNRGECPPWHKGAGGKSWIFADEIRVWERGG
ncbi:MAG: GH92 family glycosyl hydrolase [Phaeodactylibacter sp.]|nr:GH92 family glycosyl hydrolase [Phaeodactylibacter sp.]